MGPSAICALGIPEPACMITCILRDITCFQRPVTYGVWIPSRMANLDCGRDSCRVVRNSHHWPPSVPHSLLELLLSVIPLGTHGVRVRCLYPLRVSPHKTGRAYIDIHVCRTDCRRESSSWLARERSRSGPLHSARLCVQEPTWRVLLGGVQTGYHHDTPAPNPESITATQ